ncbi:MAG: hypothetical protein JWM57_1924 [Phycisphaerales bacterium]|nr:hypothetical protein [Phycisphaerales bacterium]
MNMPKVAIVIGALLEMVGMAGFAHAFSHGVVAKTALIPSFLGSIFIVLGILSLAQPNLRKHLMHGLAMLALLGFLAGAGRLAMTLTKADANPVAQAASGAMAVLCAVALFFCIKSFREARKAREAAAITA